MTRSHYDTLILTDGNFNHIHGFGIPCAIAIKDNDIVGVQTGYVNLHYPCSLISECVSVAIGMTLATNYCDRKDEKYGTRGRVVLKNDNSSVVSILNGSKKNSNGKTNREARRLLVVPKFIKNSYKINVKHTNGDHGLPHNLSKNIERILLTEAEKYRQSVPVILKTF